MARLWPLPLGFSAVFLPEVRECITRHTAYNKHDTGWAKGVFKARTFSSTRVGSLKVLSRAMAASVFPNGAWDAPAA